MRLGTPRSPVVVLLLTFLTCGFYYYYFIYVVSAETQDFLGQTELNMSPGMELLLTIITFGIWNIYWDYRMGKRMATMCQMVGLPVTDNAVLYLILDLVGFGIINEILEQDTLNRIWKAAMYGPVPAGAPWPTAPGASWPPPVGSQPPPSGSQPHSSSQSWYDPSQNQTPRQPRPPLK